jgi:dihydropteroate synthase
MSMVRRSLSAAHSAARAAQEPLGGLLATGRPIVMGILNVTPDSFSDGGRFNDPVRAIAHAAHIVEEGADIIDIGAESTRPYPGMLPVSRDEEMARLKPVLPAVIKLGVPVSIDTIKVEVGKWALDQGAAILNDVWGLQRDPDMAKLAADRRVPLIIMHNRTEPDPDIDIIADIRGFFARSLDIAAIAGISREAIVLDPGIGFGKTQEQSMQAIARLDALHDFGMPILVGASRKRFINTVVPTEPDQRLPGSLAAHILAVENGASIIRTHDVAETVQALRVHAAIRSAT